MQSSRGAPAAAATDDRWRAMDLATHEGLVRWVVRQQWRGELSWADALHEGRLGLWQALRHYDVARGTRVSSYAVPAIRHAVWDAVARGHAAPDPAPTATVPLATAVARGDGPVAPDPAAAVVAHLAHGPLVVALRALVDQLPAPLRRVVVGHYGLDGGAPQTFAALGQALGVTRQRAHQLHTAALLWLAHPAHSLVLRRLLGRAQHDRVAYQRTFARQRRHLRARRRRGLVTGRAQEARR